jgi:hypothetical protein
MKPHQIIQYAGLIIALGTAVGPESCLQAADGKSDNPVIARGAGFEVHQQEVNIAFAVFNASRGSRSVGEPRETIEARLLDHIIETRILLQKSTAAEQKAATEAAGEKFSKMRERFDTEEHFRDWLKTTSMTSEQYRQRIYEQEVCNRVIDRELQPAASVSEADIEKYYNDNAKIFDRPEQVRLRQIYLSTFDPQTETDLPAEKRAEKSQLAKTLKAKLDAGGDFSKLALEFSDDPTKDTTDLDAPVYSRAILPPEVGNIAFAMSTNQISDVIKGCRGFYLIKVVEKQPATRLPLSEVSGRLKELLINMEVRRLMPGYLEKIRREAGVEIVAKSVATPAPAEPGTK